MTLDSCDKMKIAWLLDTKSACKAWAELQTHGNMFPMSQLCSRGFINSRDLRELVLRDQKQNPKLLLDTLRATTLRPLSSHTAVRWTEGLQWTCAHEAGRAGALFCCFPRRRFILCLWRARGKNFQTLKLYTQRQLVSVWIHTTSQDVCWNNASDSAKLVSQTAHVKHWLDVSMWEGRRWQRNKLLIVRAGICWGLPMRLMLGQALQCIVVIQSLSCVWLFVTPWTAAGQASLSFTISWSLLKLISIESVMPSNHLILCCSFLLLLSVFPSIRTFFNESAFCIRWPSIRASASVLAMNIQGWFPLGLTGLILLIFFSTLFCLILTTTLWGGTVIIPIL